MQSYKVTRTAIKDQKSPLTAPVGHCVSAAGSSGSSHRGERVMKLEKGRWDNDMAGVLSEQRRTRQSSTRVVLLKQCANIFISFFRMIIKGKGVPEEPVQKKKRAKSSKSQPIIEIEKGVQTDTGTGGETKTKVRKKEKLKEDECLDQLELKKKKKKHKKKKVGSKLLKEARSESLVSIESHPDSEPGEEWEERIKILKKKKKKAQCHCSLSLENNQSRGVELSHHATGGTKENEFAFKRSRQNIAWSLGVDGEVTKKKKKGVLNFPLEDGEHKLCEKAHKKPHKHISLEKAFRSENHGIEIIQNDGESYMKRKKKKKKDKSASFLPLTDNEEDINGVPNSPTALSDFRKRPRKNSQEITWTNTEEEETTGSVRESKRKKRSKDVCSLPCEGDRDRGHRAPDKQLPVQGEAESEEKELSGKKHRRDIVDNNEVIKKKKKVRKEEEETTYSNVSLNSASKSQKLMLLESNKKNKERGMKRAEHVAGEGGDQVLRDSNRVLCDRKRKRRKNEVLQDFAEDPGSKANTQKMEREEVGDEALVSCERAGSVHPELRHRRLFRPVPVCGCCVC